MKKLLSTLLLIVLISPTAFAADPLDFSDAAFRVKIGSQATVVRANSQAKEMKIDGKNVRIGEILSNGMKIEWLIAPSTEVGDEYVFVVRRAKDKPKTYSVIFKSGHLLVVSQDDITIEIEN